MCVGVPARVLRVDGLRADCASRDGPCTVDLSLTGVLVPGTWVLTFFGTAREVIDEARAHDIQAALDALDAIARGETAIDAYFADLADREPVLPDHLREKVMR
jgi:hydrogenase expression/formation protein HypC